MPCCASASWSRASRTMSCAEGGSGGRGGRPGKYPPPSRAGPRPPCGGGGGGGGPGGGPGDRPAPRAPGEEGEVRAPPPRRSARRGPAPSRGRARRGRPRRARESGAVRARSGADLTKALEPFANRAACAVEHRVVAEELVLPVRGLGERVQLERQVARAGVLR